MNVFAFAGSLRNDGNTGLSVRGAFEPSFRFSSSLSFITYVFGLVLRLGPSCAATTPQNYSTTVPYILYPLARLFA